MYMNATLLYLHLSDTDGSVYLDLVDVGNVEERRDNNFVFVYRENESNLTIFNGKYMHIHT